ncbi:SAM domain protein [Senna tora]|uniref:SAM domain protein n=1 Tax=Senna tora TaxID=362788 RepID=A0A834SS12_9FABA|nr:SAM domain protein [Senna tora]
MDWFSWLSRTNLDPSLTYDYGLTFARNELEPRDAAFFDHEFLQSMGISIAKHRLEILKLARKDTNNGSYAPHRKLSGAIKKCFRKCVSKFVTRDPPPKEIPPEPSWYVERMIASFKEEKLVSSKPKPNNRTRAIAFSGPLDGRVHHEKVVANNNKMLKLSGPLDGRMLQYANRSPLMSRPMKSPTLSGPLDGKSPRLTRASDAGAPDSPMGFSPYYSNSKSKSDCDYYDDESTHWPALFQDMKPT